MIDEQIEKVARAINAGQVGVMPTDTIYGIVGRADMPAVVERIYRVKDRDYKKPFVVLISDLSDLSKLKIMPTDSQKQTLQELWPGPNSIILPCPDDAMEHLHRGLSSLAVRLPALEWLRELLKLTGPIVATSANISGQDAGQSISIIKKQLRGLDFYIEGEVGSIASRLGPLAADGTIEWLKRN